MGWYVIQNDELIGRVARLHGFKGDTFWWKIDRQARTILDEATGVVYPIPDDWNLT